MRAGILPVPWQEEGGDMRSLYARTLRRDSLEFRHSWWSRGRTAVALSALLVSIVSSGCQNSGELLRFTLEVDCNQSDIGEADEVLDRVIAVLRRRMSNFGIRQVVFQKLDGDRIGVDLRTSDDPRRVAILFEFRGALEFRFVDMQEHFLAALPAIDRALADAHVTTRFVSANPNPTAIEQLLEPYSPTASVDSAIGETDHTDEIVESTPLSSHLFRGQIPGEFVVQEEHYLKLDSILQLEVTQLAIPRGVVLFWGSEPMSRGSRSYRPLYAVEDRAIITGEYLDDASATVDQQTEVAYIRFELTSDGGRIFERETAAHVDEYMAIIFDGRVYRQPPIIRTKIGRHGQIELGQVPPQEALDLAIILISGSLPVPVRVVAVDTILQ